MQRSPLVGTWKLAAFELRAPDGEVTYPYGPDVTGCLIYNEDGYMSTAITSADRARTGDSADLAEAGASVNYDAFMAYCGTYEVNGDRILHRVEVSSLPVWTGTLQERMYKLDGDRLTILTAPLLVASDTPTGYLIWDRVGSEASAA